MYRGFEAWVFPGVRSHIRKIFLLCSACVGLNGATPTLAETVIADRPGFSTGTYTVEPGHFNVELGYEASFSNSGASRTTHTAPLTDVRVGVVPEMEIDLMWSGWSIDRVAGNSSTSDMAIGGKYRLVSQPQYNITALGVLSLPTGSTASSGEMNPTVALIWDYVLSDSVTAFGMAQVASSVESADRHYNLQPAVGLSFDLTDKLGTFVEFYSDKQLMPHTQRSDMMDTGITYLLTDSTQLDFSVGLSLDNRSDDFVGAGIAMRF